MVYLIENFERAGIGIARGAGWGRATVVAPPAQEQACAVARPRNYAVGTNRLTLRVPISIRLGARFAPDHPTPDLQLDDPTGAVPVHDFS